MFSRIALRALVALILALSICGAVRAKRAAEVRGVDRQLRSAAFQLPAWVARNARAYIQSRSTVRGEMAISSATRGSGNPAK